MAKSIRRISYGSVNYNKRQQFLIKLVRQERRLTNKQNRGQKEKKTMRTKQTREEWKNA